MSDEPEDLATERHGFLRIPNELYARWLRRSHREGTDPDKAGAIQLERALRRPGSIVGEDAVSPPGPPSQPPDDEPADETTEEPDELG